MNSDVITEAKIPTKAFCYVNENYEPEGIEIWGDSLPDSFEDHVGEYYYDGEQLYLIVEENGNYKEKEIEVKGILPAPLGEDHVDSYYYTYEGVEVVPIGISSFDRIWGTIKDDNDKEIIINLQDAMNALYKMMTSQSHVWVGNGNNIPRYAKLLIETDKQ